MFEEMQHRLARVLAWIILISSLAFYTATPILLAQIPLAKIGPHSALWPFDPIDLGMLVFLVVGLIIILHHPRHTVGWLFLWIGFSRFTFGITNAYIVHASLVDPRLPVNNWVLWLPSRLWVITFFISPLLLLVFPDGRLLSRRWRWLVGALLLVNGLMLVSAGSLVEAGSFSFEMPSLLDMLGHSGLTGLVRDLGADLLVLVLLAMLVYIWLRFRRARGEQRLQLKWFTFAALSFLLINLVLDFGFFDIFSRLDPSAKVPADLFLGIPSALSFAVIPLAAGFAIQRYHLYDIDIIIRKTLIYGALTASLALVYAGSVIILQSIVRGLTGEGESPIAIVISTLAIASLFMPLRRRIQTLIDRRFYRHRYDAEQVLTAFSSAVRNEVDLSQLSSQFLDVVDQTIQPSNISLWMKK
jgi:hypothetical protein